MSTPPPSSHRDNRRTLTLALLVFALLLAAILAVGALLFLARTGSEDKALRDIELQVVANLHEQLRYDISAITSDLIFLAHQHDMDDLFLDRDAIRPAARAELLRDFLLICKSKGIYSQISVLDVDGRELLRVNSAGGVATVVPDDALQVKKNSYYFQGAMGLGRDAIYVSPLDLNIEHGIVVRPLEPTIRFATPLFDRQGNKRGLLVLNYLAQRMLRAFRHPPSGAITETMLLNREGYWLKGSRPEQEWGFMFADRRQQTFGAAYPNAWRQIADNNQGQFETPAGLFTFSTVFPLNAGMKSSSRPTADTAAPTTPLGHDQYFWKIVSLVPRQSLDIKRQAWLHKISIIVGVIALLLGFVCWRLARARMLRIHTQASLLMRERYLRALNHGAELLLPHQEIPYQEYLNCIGPATEADRAAIFLEPTQQKPGEESFFRLQAAWPTSAATADLPALLHLPRQFPNWTPLLTRGEVITGASASFSVPERQILESHGITNILILPLLIDGRLLGLMQFYNCSQPHLWRAPEVDFLRNAAHHLTRMINQRQHESALLRAKNEWERTFDSVPDSIAIIDLHHHVLRVNKALAAQVGRPPRECIGAICHQLLHSQDLPFADCPHRRLLMDGQPHTAEFHEPNTGRYFHISVSPLQSDSGELLGSVHVARDITKRKQAEAALFESHQRLLTVFDSLDALVYVIDMASHEILFLNRYAKNIFGEVTGRICWQAIQIGQTGPCDFCPNANLLLQNGTISETSHIWELHNAQNNRWYENHDKAIKWLDGRLVKIQIATDITDRRETRQTLEAREEQLRTLINATPDVVCLKDDKGRWLEANRSHLALFRLEGIDYRHKTDSELAQQTLPLFRPAFATCARTDEMAWRAGRAHQQEETIPTPDGPPKVYDFIKVPVFHHDGRRKGLVVLGREITQRKRAEEKLLEYAETQEVLLREVNHRVKNNLAAIISMLHKEEDRAEADGRPDSITLLHDLEGRIQGLSAVHSLLTEHAWRPLPLAEVCKRVAQAAMQTAPLSHTVEIRVADTDLKVSSGQAHQLALVINELVTNSIKHGMPPQGKSLLDIDIAAEESDGMTRLRFRDNGPGFPKTILAGDYRRSNIGFDLINGIVKRSLRGAIALTNNGGAETTIRFKTETGADTGQGGRHGNQ